MKKHTPRQWGSGTRQVLNPGKTKAARHPWADRLREVLDGKPTTKADKP